MSLPDYFNNPNRYKGHYDFYSMFNDCGIEERGGDDVLNTPGTMSIKGTSTIADGTFLGYYPKFFGMGKSDKVCTKIVLINGRMQSVTLYDKSGDVIGEALPDPDNPNSITNN